MKIVTDLERIGDQAVNIAQRTQELNREPQLKPYIDLPRMADKAQRMVKESLDAFVGRDTELARRVCGEDAEVGDSTTNVLLEAANFDAVSTRKSSVKYDLRTEAARRFERGTSSRLPPVAARPGLGW